MAAVETSKPEDKTEDKTAMESSEKEGKIDAVEEPRKMGDTQTSEILDVV